MFLLFSFIIFLCDVVEGHYCDSRECPGFSLIEKVQIERVTADSLEITWNPKENYSIERYEVHWYSNYKCDRCSGTVSLLNTTILKLNVQACKMYFLEVYAFEVNNTITAPGQISQLTVADPPQNGTAVRINSGWAILRWFQVCDCPNSTFLVVCSGPNFITQIKPYNPDRVVLFNVSVLKENSSYVCVSYTINAAGSSHPSWPIFFTTVGETQENHDGSQSLFGYTMAIILITVAVFLTLTSILIYLTKYETFKVPWRRSYDVSQPTI